MTITELASLYSRKLPLYYRIDSMPGIVFEATCIDKLLVWLNEDREWEASAVINDKGHMLVVPSRNIERRYRSWERKVVFNE